MHYTIEELGNRITVTDDWTGKVIEEYFITEWDVPYLREQYGYRYEGEDDDGQIHYPEWLDGFSPENCWGWESKTYDYQGGLVAQDTTDSRLLGYKSEEEALERLLNCLSSQYEIEEDETES